MPFPFPDVTTFNGKRAREEQAGTIRYLRPDYQRPGGAAPGQQMGMDLVTETAEPTAAVALLTDWPKELAQQVQAIRTVSQQAGQPLSAEQIAARFQRTSKKPQSVQPLLDTLTALALLRLTPEGLYAA